MSFYSFPHIQVGRLDDIRKVLVNGLATGSVSTVLEASKGHLCDSVLFVGRLLRREERSVSSQEKWRPLAGQTDGEYSKCYYKLRFFP
jgi:hypothetical protein